MAREPQSKAIGGRTYQVTPLPAMRALKLSNRLVRIAGPALAKAFGGAKDVKGLLDLDVAQLSPALALLTDRLTDAELEGVLQELLSTCLVDGKPVVPQFDLLFQGELGQALEVAGFALEVNFGGFFGLLQRSTAASAAAAKPASPPPESSPPTLKPGQ